MRVLVYRLWMIIAILGLMIISLQETWMRHPPRVSAQVSLDEWSASTGLPPDQKCPPYTLTDTAQPEDPTLFASPSPAKLTLSTDSNEENLFYIQTGPYINFSASTFIEARLRFVSGSSSLANFTAAGIFFTTAPDVGNILWIGQDEIFLWSAIGIRGQTASVDTDGAFHTYRIEIETNGSVTVLQDGDPVLTGSTFNAPNFVDAPAIDWGDGTGSASGVSEWEFVRHNAGRGTPPDCAACTPPPSGMVSWWPGDGNANDIQGPTLENGTLQGNATFAAGRVGQAFSFDGANNTGVLIGNPANLQLQDFTIDAWIKRSRLDVAGDVGGTTGGQGVIVAYGHDGYGFGLTPDGQLFLTRVDVSAVFSGAALRVTDTAFHHVAVTKSGSTVVFYLDGVASAPATYNEVFAFTKNFAIGARLDVSPPTTSTHTTTFAGILDEVEVFNRPLLQSEIQAIVNAGSAGKCRSCVPPPAQMASW